MEIGFIEANVGNLPKVSAITIDAYFTAEKQILSNKTSDVSNVHYEDNAISDVQVKRTGQLCTVKCKLLVKDGKHYNISMVVDEKECVLQSLVCHDCDAPGSCIHAFVLLLWVHRRTTDPFSRLVSFGKQFTIENCKGQQCVTAKELTKAVPCVSSNPCVDLGFLKEPERIMLNDQFSTYYTDDIQNKTESVSMYSLVLKYKEEDCEAFLKNVVLSDCLIQCVQMFTNINQRKPVWYRIIYGRITSSKAYEVSQCEKSNKNLITDILLRDIQYPKASVLKRRILLRDSIKNVIKASLCLNVEIKNCGLFISRKYPMIVGAPDGICNDKIYMLKCPLSSCSPQDVIVNIKHGSYPAVNPDGYDFPQHFVDPATREHIHTIELLSDGRNRTYSIRNPRPGNWYALVYKKWEDPRTQKVEQQGLVADCHTILYTDLQVKREEEIKFIDCYSGLTLDYASIPSYFKCMSVDSSKAISFKLTIKNTSISDKEILFRVQALALPTVENYLLSCAFDAKLNNEQTINFNPYNNAWHYITLEHIQGNASRYADCESYYLSTDLEDVDNRTTLDLMRDDKGRFFTFGYGLPTTDLQDTTSLVNITSGEIRSLRLNVNQFLDIGGNFGIQASLLMNFKYYMGYRRKKNKDSLLTFTEDDQFFKLVICLDIGYSSVPLESGHCKFNDKVRPALFVLNSTDSETVYERVIIPYPESGTWYLTLRLFCDSVVCPCRTSDNGKEYYVDPNGDRDSNIGSNYTRQGETVCNATAVLALSSTSCLSGRCSNHGTCGLNTFGGLVMSFCSCPSGYGNWDCSDDSRMDSRVYMLVSVLLLTLSNLPFFFSIYVALIRFYYSEAMMYTFTMVFSTFYHACDAPPQVAYCITRGNILQFGDFYCGLMSFWVTLLAMSIIKERFRSSLQLTGAIVIALLTTWNMHSFIAFLLPVAVGVGVLIISWWVDYYKMRRLRYPRAYYTIHLPIGVALVTVGLVCYAFLQTEQNYKIVHSIWHMIIAGSVAFLLPDVKRSDVNPFLPIPGYFKSPFWKIFNRSQAPVAAD